MLGGIMANHMSRVGCATGDLKEFGNLINKIAEEE